MAANAPTAPDGAILFEFVVARGPLPCLASLATWRFRFSDWG